MPVELLKDIANKQLPLILTNPGDIDKLRMLSADGLVLALFPKANEFQTQATLLALTAKGRKISGRDERTGT